MFKAAGVIAYPKKSKQWLDQTISMIAYRETPVNDGVSFQWKRKLTADANFSDIDGATSHFYELKRVKNSDKGQYKCTIRFSDGSNSDTNVIEVDDTLAMIEGTDLNKFHSANKLYKGPYYHTHIRWDALDKLVAIGNDPTLTDADKFKSKIAEDKDLAHIYYLLARYGYIKMKDSRNGYTYIIDETSKYPDGVIVEGPFKNYWKD
ncbi:MAG: hypothetical protein ACRC9Y_03215 [Aeromonas veronii]